MYKLYKLYIYYDYYYTSRGAIEENYDDDGRCTAVAAPDETSWSFNYYNMASCARDAYFIIIGIFGIYLYDGCMQRIPYSIIKVEMV